MTIAPGQDAQNDVRQINLLTKTTNFILQLRREGLLRLEDVQTFEFRARVHLGDVKVVQTVIGQAGK